jgi:hypothetical protein
VKRRYGLVVDETGKRKFVLAARQHKYLATDRVVLVPGPKEEVETVRWIYRAFLKTPSETRIAAILNSKGIRSDFGKPWTLYTVREIIRNEKYIGNNVWNRSSGKASQSTPSSVAT